MPRMNAGVITYDNGKFGHYSTLQNLFKNPLKPNNKTPEYNGELLEGSTLKAVARIYCCPEL